mmetsp:Transcript_23390/g.51804  ORF Transcript_23390/g.51804 Transcript_23390/m.51804 type:complete len:102 (+) Transcript_23390:253-558(+)
MSRCHKDCETSFQTFLRRAVSWSDGDVVTMREIIARGGGQQYLAWNQNIYYLLCQARRKDDLARDSLPGLDDSFFAIVIKAEMKETTYFCWTALGGRLITS